MINVFIRNNKIRKEIIVLQIFYEITTFKLSG